MIVDINGKKLEISEKDFVNEIGQALINAIGLDNTIHWKLKRSKAQDEQDSLQSQHLKKHRTIFLETQWGKITLCTDPKDIAQKNRIRGADGVTYYISGIDFDLSVSAKMGEDAVFRLYGSTKIYNNTGFNDKKNKVDFENKKKQKIDSSYLGYRSVVNLDDDKVGKIIVRNKENKSAQEKLPLLLKNEEEVGQDLGIDISAHHYQVYKKSADAGIQEVSKTVFTMPNMKKNITKLVSSQLSIRQWFSILYQVVDLSLALNEGALTTSKKKLLNRDLKPENFIVDLSYSTDGKVQNVDDTPSVSLCDYETMIEIGSDNKKHAYGTSVFLPPEIIPGKPETYIYSFSTEIYTLGAALSDIFLMIAKPFIIKNTDLYEKFNVVRGFLRNNSYAELRVEHNESITEIENVVSDKLTQEENILWLKFRDLSNKMRKILPEDRPKLQEVRQELNEIFSLIQANGLLPKNAKKIDQHHRHPEERAKFEQKILARMARKAINPEESNCNYIQKAEKNYNMQSYGFPDYEKSNKKYQSMSCCLWFKKHGNSGISRAKELVSAFLKKKEGNDSFPDLEARKEGIATFFMKTSFGHNAQNNDLSFIRYFLVACKETGEDLNSLFNEFKNTVTCPTELPTSVDDKDKCKEWLQAFKKLAIEINKQKNHPKNYSTISQ